ncbi:MAG: hypothetical protein M1823_009015, partial [Watsoniomyces obsoletus]
SRFHSRPLQLRDTIITTLHAIHPPKPKLRRQRIQPVPDITGEEITLLGPEVLPLRQILLVQLLQFCLSILYDTLHLLLHAATARGFDGYWLPRLADTPDITVELIRSGEAPGGVSELAIPPVAPAIANALHAATGYRIRRLPLRA